MARWRKSDRPYDSLHLEAGSCGGRVRPVSDGWEWSSWIGPPGHRVLQAAGKVATKAAAKRRAARSCEVINRLGLKP